MTPYVIPFSHVKREKLLERLLASNKVPNDISADEFLNLVRYLGLQVRPGKGSHTIVKDAKDWHMTVATGHAAPIDPKAIKTLIDKIKEDKKED